MSPAPKSPVEPKLLTVLVCLSAAIAIGASLWWPTSPDEEFRRGQVALARGEWVAVSQHIKRLRQSPAHANQVRLLRGGLLLRIGDAREAIAELSRARADGKLQEQALLLLCEARYQLKQWLEAAQLAQELMRVHSDHPEAHRWLGAIYFDLGAFAQSEMHLKELARLMPSDYSPHRLLGVIHKDFERYQEAIHDFQQALQRNPTPAVALQIRLDLSKAQAKNNDYEAALKTLDVSWPAGSVEHRPLEIECLWSINCKDEAKQKLQKALADRPDDPDVLWQVVRIALDEGRTQDALRPLQEIVKADPFNHQMLYDLALVYRRLGQEAEADLLLERSNMARALLQQLVELNQRVIDDPSNAKLRDELASVCDQLGKKQLAAIWRDAAQALKSTSSQ